MDSEKIPLSIPFLNGGFGFMELGVTMIYLFGFLWVVLSNLAKQKLIAVNHPMLQESIHHTT